MRKGWQQDPLKMKYTKLKATPSWLIPLCAITLCSSPIKGEENSRVYLPDTLSDTFISDTLSLQANKSPRFLHRIEADGRIAYIFPTHSFLKGYNNQGLIMKGAASYHIKYAFQFVRPDKVHYNTYQGIGLSYYDFGNPKDLGNPLVLYLYQGAPITRLSQRLSFNYEWNFGISFGWKPFDKITNPTNKVIGSRVNAYMNTSFYLNWRLNKFFDLNFGIEGTHFSNGNTKYPNLGLNTMGIRTGLVYFINRPSLEKSLPERPSGRSISKHLSYDLTLFGSWRRTGVAYEDGLYLAPKAYPVLGFSFSPMYKLSEHFKAGISCDGVYDGGSQIKGVTRNEIIPYGNPSENNDYGFDIVRPPFRNQLSVGLSARGEFVMPFFSINFGMGFNILNTNKDLKFFYQTLTLKIDLIKNMYLNIGYNLKNFQEPNYLMLGLGYRFNNKKR